MVFEVRQSWVAETAGVDRCLDGYVGEYDGAGAARCVGTAIGGNKVELCTAGRVEVEVTRSSEGE